MSGFDANSSGGEPIRGGGENAQDGDESHSSEPESVATISQISHADTDASAFRYDISAADAADGEVRMKPVRWEK